MRTAYREFPKYHTSLDDLSLISPRGLEGAFGIIQSGLAALEANHRYQATFPCEPLLGRRGLYPALGTTGDHPESRRVLNLLAYAEGEADLLQVAGAIGVGIMECAEIAEGLHALDLLRRLP